MPLLKVAELDKVLESYVWNGQIFLGDEVQIVLHASLVRLSP